MIMIILLWDKVAKTVSSTVYWTYSYSDAYYFLFAIYFAYFLANAFVIINELINRKLNYYRSHMH